MLGKIATPYHLTIKRYGLRDITTGAEPPPINDVLLQSAMSDVRPGDDEGFGPEGYMRAAERILRHHLREWGFTMSQRSGQPPSSTPTIEMAGRPIFSCSRTKQTSGRPF